MAVVPGGDLDRILSREHGDKWVIRFYINTHTHTRDASMLYIIYNIYIYIGGGTNVYIIISFVHTAIRHPVGCAKKKTSAMDSMERIPSLIFTHIPIASLYYYY